MKFLRTTSTCLILFLTLASSFAFAQDESLDEILEAHFEVVGQENLADVETIKQTGTILTQGLSIPMTMMLKRPNMMRINANIGGAEAVFMAYDGTNGWAIQPWTGTIDPIDLPEDQLKEAMQQADLDGPLFNYEEKGHSLELEGTEEVEGTETYKLKLTMKSGDVLYYFLDTEAYVPIKITSKTTMEGQEFEQEQFLSNYKMVDGFAVAHSIETKVMGNTALQITVNEVIVNPEIEDSYFKKPGTN
ncbi:MAG: outer membrane lipoprotein-sorting protein [bacterium]|nr:outer membrane lipoprotein-sorting protein [bacterium]